MRYILSNMSLAVFLAWSDEYRKAGDRQAKEAEAIDKMFLSVGRKIKEGINPLRALQEEHVDELETNDQLIAFCDKLKKHGSGHPLENYASTKNGEQWQIHPDHGWKIIRISAVESRCSRIHSGRWRRKSGGRPAWCEAEEARNIFLLRV
jgi:hypothetical protein